jgi:hypothetical protein
VAARRGRESDHVSRVAARALMESAHMGGIVVDAKGFSIPCCTRCARVLVVLSFVLAIEGGAGGHRRALLQKPSRGRTERSQFFDERKLVNVLSVPVFPRVNANFRIARSPLHEPQTGVCQFVLCDN